MKNTPVLHCILSFEGTSFKKQLLWQEITIFSKKATRNKKNITQPNCMIQLLIQFLFLYYWIPIREHQQKTCHA